MTSGETRLREALREVGSIPMGEVDFDALSRRRRRRTRTRWTAAAAIGGAAAGVIIWSAASGTDSAGVATVVPARPTVPSVRDISVECDGHAITAEALSQPGNAEKGSSAASAHLRQFLQHNPFEGMGSVPNTNWLTLVDTPTELAFGHREGPVGVGPVVSLHLKDGRVVGQNLGGCGTVLVENGRTSEPIGAASAQGRTVVLYWSNGSCGGTTLDRRFVRTEVRETADSVHVLLVSEANPAVPKVSGNVFCAGVGRESHNTVTLKAPLGGRTLYDDSRLTPEKVTISEPQPSPAATSAPAVPTGIRDTGPQISGTRWMNVNSWTGGTTASALTSVYAGGATIDPSLQSDATQAAVLVITPNDLYRFDHNQVALNSIGTIYRPPGDPTGKLKVTAASGNLLTLNLVGTSQFYTFNTSTYAFQ